MAIPNLIEQNGSITKRENKMKLQNPQNYKTQSGLLKALNRASEMDGDISLFWWFQNAKHSLINTWGWGEQDAARYIMGYMPKLMIGKATEN